MTDFVNKVDWTKPLEWSDGTPITSVVHTVSNGDRYDYMTVQPPLKNAGHVWKDNGATNRYAPSGLYVRNSNPVKTDKELADRLRELNAETYTISLELEKRGFIVEMEGEEIEFGKIDRIYKTETTEL